MLRKFICEVHHHNFGDKSQVREHIVYMPESEYDKSGSRWRNHNWVEKKIKDKLGDQWISGKGAIYSISRIYQERL